mmetsp:Transcript_7658/g.12499  ORF Transcript_7658/g.12499 Transcript_7658/m.12499 type:complete len:116 (-) Transcript_7658:158-505(-)
MPFGTIYTKFMHQVPRWPLLLETHFCAIDVGFQFYFSSEWKTSLCASSSLECFSSLSNFGSLLLQRFDDIFLCASGNPLFVKITERYTPRINQTRNIIGVVFIKSTYPPERIIIY